MQKLVGQRGSHTNPAYMTQLDISQIYKQYQYIIYTNGRGQ